MILKSLVAKLDILKKNAHYGDKIQKKIIPNYYRNKYGISNLFRIELPQFWRMLYSLTKQESEIEIIAFVLDLMDHNEYNRKLGYKNR